MESAEEWRVWERTGPWLDAVARGRAPEVRRRLEEGAADDDLADALTEAVELGHSQVVRVLLEFGAQPTARHLGTAAQNNHVDIVEQLLATGAVDADDHGGGVAAHTPLYCAAGRGHVEAVEALLAAGASVHKEALPGLTALLWAAANRYVRVSVVLLRAGADAAAARAFALTDNCDEMTHVAPTLDAAEAWIRGECDGPLADLPGAGCFYLDRPPTPDTDEESESESEEEDDDACSPLYLAAMEGQRAETARLLAAGESEELALRQARRGAAFIQRRIRATIEACRMEQAEREERVGERVALALVARRKGQAYAAGFVAGFL